MRDSMRPLIMLAVLIFGCEQTPTPTEAPAAPTEKKTVATADPLPLPSAGRRERAGIEVAEKQPATTKTPSRVPAAEFIKTAPPATAPKMNMGARGGDALNALKWLHTTWRPAALDTKATTYTALLHETFKGRAPNQATPSLGTDWIPLRVPALGTAVTWGLERVIANPTPDGRLTIQFLEVQGGDTDTCTFGRRTLGLIPVEVKGAQTWQLASEERADTAPCPKATLDTILEVTERLRLAWKARDLTAVQSAVGSLTLLDSGVETERYSVASLTTGPGRWILDQFSAITATSANTRLVGDTAILKAPNGDRFALRLVGQAWRLTSLWRKSP